MDKNFVVSLPRIQLNSAELLNKLDNSVPVCYINFHILNSLDIAYGSLKTLHTEYAFIALIIFLLLLPQQTTNH